MSLFRNVLSGLFSIQDYSLTDISIEPDHVLLSISRDVDSLCSRCGRVCSRYDSRVRTFFTSSLNGIAIYCRVKIYRVTCPEHGIVVEDHGISDGQKRYSKAAGASVVQYTRYLDNVSTGKHMACLPAQFTGLIGRHCAIWLTLTVQVLLPIPC